MVLPRCCLFSFVFLFLFRDFFGLVVVDLLGGRFVKDVPPLLQNTQGIGPSFQHI